MHRPMSLEVMLTAIDQVGELEVNYMKGRSILGASMAIGQFGGLRTGDITRSYSI